MQGCKWMGDRLIGCAESRKKREAKGKAKHGL